MRTKPLHKTIAFCLSLLLLPSCAERAWIRSAPPNAKVYVNDRFIGVTPVVYSVHRPEFYGPLHYRAVLDGYDTAEGDLQKRTGPPRIVAACFTLGISLLFKPPTTLQDRYDIALQMTPREAAARLPAPAEVRREPPPTETTPDDGIRRRLRELQDLRERGLITDQEFKRSRQNILNDL
jgi:hypothetical protein